MIPVTYDKRVLLLKFIKYKVKNTKFNINDEQSILLISVFDISFAWNSTEHIIQAVYLNTILDTYRI